MEGDRWFSSRAIAGAVVAVALVITVGRSVVAQVVVPAVVCNFDASMCVPSLAEPVVSSVAGRVMGGGQTFNPTGTDEIIFSLSARIASATVSDGQCHVTDHEYNVRIRCLTVLAMLVSPTSAVIVGTGEQNGVPIAYRIDVNDFGEPGYQTDRFMIQTSLGYVAGGSLLVGNIQIQGGLVTVPPAPATLPRRP